MKRVYKQEFAEVKETRTLLITGIKNEDDNSSVKLKLLEFGDIRETYTIPNKNIIFAIFYDVRDSITAKNALNDTTLGCSDLKVYFTISKHEIPKENDVCDETRNQGTVLLISRDFIAPINDSEIEKILSVYGDIREMREYKAFQKFVEFCDSRSTIKACTDFGEMKYKGGTLLVRYLWDMTKKARWDIIRETDAILVQLDDEEKKRKKEKNKCLILKAFDDFIIENIDRIGELK